LRLRPEIGFTISCALRTGVSLWVAYYRRGLEKFVAIREALDAGMIGEPRSVVIEFSQDRERYATTDGSGPWRVDPATAGAGIIADMGSHMLDLIDWFFGPLSAVTSIATNLAGDYEAEDVVAANFIAGTHVVGSALWDLSGRRETDRTIIRGSEGSIEYSTFDDAPPMVTKAGATQALDTKPFPPHVHQPLIELINGEIRGGKPAPSTAVSGARTNRVLDSLVREYYSRRSK
jgi:predicted dehydrogenase